MEWRRLSSLESALLGQLMACDFPGRAQLTPQVMDAMVTAIDGDGSVKFKRGDTPPASEVKYRVPTEGEFEDWDGITVHVLLHVTDGYIDEIEVYKEDQSVIRDWSGAWSLRVFAPE